MATYKVLQDIEAEDKLLGPLTLKQFIFAIIFVALAFLAFKISSTTALSIVRWPIVIALLFPMVVFGFLAAPISRDQPNDVWLLARVRFLVKPHRRVWNQDGISQLVTITAPKRMQRIFTNGLNAIEVQSRLSALASTLDSRGWAVKNVDVNMFGQPGYLATADGSDRLVAPTNLPINQQTIDIKAADDMLDAHNNPTAQNLDRLVQQSTAAHRQQVIQSVQQPVAGAVPVTPQDYWFMNQQAAAAPLEPGLARFQNRTVVAPTATPHPAVGAQTGQRDELEQPLGEAYLSHLKTIKPLANEHQGSSNAGQAATTGSAQDTQSAQAPIPQQDFAPKEPPPILTQDDSQVTPLSPSTDQAAPQSAAAMPAADQTYAGQTPVTGPVANDFQAPAVAPSPQPATTPSGLGQNNDYYQPSAPSMSAPNPAILRLANNDDLNVATIARQAQQISESDDEVVISLH